MVRIIAVLFMLQLLIISPSSADAALEMSIGDYEIGIGEIANIAVELSGLSEDFLADAFDFEIQFSPLGGLTASNIQPGAILPAALPGITFNSQVRSDGALAFYAVFSAEPPEIPTDGTLATFDLRGDVPGLYNLDFTRFSISRKGVTSPDAFATSGSINVVPIPSALLLLGGGLLGLIGIRRKVNN